MREKGAPRHSFCVPFASLALRCDVRAIVAATPHRMWHIKLRSHAEDFFRYTLCRLEGGMKFKHPESGPHVAVLAVVWDILFTKGASEVNLPGVKQVIWSGGAFIHYTCHAGASRAE